MPARTFDVRHRCLKNGFGSAVMRHHCLKTKSTREVFLMQAHTIEQPQPQPQTRPIGFVVADVVTPVGTFASGQSALGSFHIAAEAEVGSFASGLSAQERPEQA